MTELEKEIKNYMSFSNYIIADDMPKYVEKVNRGGWIDWGKNNLYPMELVALTNRSPLHNAIIHLKTSMLGRNGFINTNWNQETINFIKNIANQDDLEEILAKISLDYIIYGGFCLNIRWSKDRSKIAEINYISPDNVRVAVPNNDSKYPDNQRYYVCDDWLNWKKNTPVEYDGFSTVNKKNASQILYVREHRSSNNFYPVPEYIAGISLIELNYQINEFHLYTVKNQFAPSMHIHYPFTPATIEQRDQIVARMKAEFQGAKQAGNVAISFGESDKAPTIEPIAMNDSDARFQELTKTMMDGIVSAHQLTDKKLLGLEISGELGSSKNEMLESLSIFQAQYIAPKQRFIEKILNQLARINGVTDKILIQKYSSNLTPDLPISDMISLLSSTLDPRQMTEILINKGYTRDQALLFCTPKTVPAAPEQNIIAK